MASKHEPLPPLVEESAMDYAAHQKTYDRFVAVVKYAIMGFAIMVVGLYFAVIADQPVFGVVLILAAMVVPPVVGVLSRNRA